MVESIESMQPTEPPLPAITHQDIQEATETSPDVALHLTEEQLTQLNNDLGGYTVHYQLQGTWQTPSGKYLNYIVLKDHIESKIDITKIYFNIEDISKCGGFNLDLSGVNDRYHLSLLNIILEFPQSELVSDLFKEFIGSLNPLASTEVTEPLTTPRVIEGKGPKIQLKMETFTLDSGGEETEGETGAGDREVGDDEWDHQTLQPQVKMEDDKCGLVVPGRPPQPPQPPLQPHQRERMTEDERRFFELCRTVGKKPNRKLHYSAATARPAPPTGPDCPAPPAAPHSRVTCLHCKLKFTGEGDDHYADGVAKVIDHILVKHFQTFAYKCELCSLTFLSKETYSDHLTQVHSDLINSHPCHGCGLGFMSQKELKSHARLVHEEQDTGLNLKCKSCEKTFSSKKTMYAHLRGIHGISSKTVKREKPLVSMCPICGEKKKSEHNLAQHMKKFHENCFPEPIVCNLCTQTKQLRNRKYHTPYAYELHMRQIHSDGAEGKVVCEYCCKEFVGSIGKVKFALKEHIQAVHMGIRKACDECGKTFISNIVLNKHKKHVHRKLGSYPCKGCGKIFRYSQQAIDHEYKDRGMMPYECKFCVFKSADNWALAKHKKVCPGNPGPVNPVVHPSPHITTIPALNLAI